ncbi:MAG: YesN/AraC family two-component response regulator [Candidatus Latescibacterota bacterium]|jgi:YesN/AraC family two-component response regulator
MAESPDNADSTPGQDPVRSIFVLAVDDDELYLQYCQRTLARSHLHMDTALGGLAAIEKVGAQSYDIILMDITMPEMNGLECLRKLHENGCKSEVIIVTGKSDLQTAVEAMKLGAADFVTKPFDAEALVSKIEELAIRSSRPLTAEEELERRRREDRRRENDRRLDDRRADPTGDRRRGSRRNDDRRESGDRRLRHGDPVIAYIRQNATEINGRQDVATAMSLNVDQVSARVQAATGQSFRHWLNHCRLQTATRLLEDTDIEIARVAEKTGFATVQHFSRVFSNLNGLSPRKYRQQSRQVSVDA